MHAPSLQAAALVRHDELQVLDSSVAKAAVAQHAELEEEAAAKEVDKAAAKKPRS